MNRNSFILLIFLAAAPCWSFADPYQGANLIDRYQSALQHQQEAMRNLSMEVHMEGSIPKLKKQGKMSALRKISSIGKVTYKVLGFWGDDTVKKEVMARFMTAEVEAASKTVEAQEKKELEHDPEEVRDHSKDKDKDKEKDKDSKKNDIGINPENYEFKYKGLNNRNAREVHIFELKPRHKRIGLFKGELWLDPATCLPVQESGRLVKNPSVFIKKMEFVRTYEIKDGIAYLTRMQSRTETRIVGRADLSIEYANFSRQTETADEPVARLDSR